MPSRVTRLLVKVALLVLFTAIAASAQSCVAPCVAAGTDYLATGNGTYFDFSAQGFSSSVQLQGNPNPKYCNGCSVDTIVQRQEDAMINGAAVPLRVVYLSLCSLNPAGGKVCFGVPNNNGFHYQIFVVLDPGSLPQNTGTMMINGDSSGGTFDSSFEVNFLATFVTTDGGPAIPQLRAAFTLSSTGTSWTPTPPPNVYLVHGPYTDQAADLHDGGGLPADYVDFFITTFVREKHPMGKGIHAAGPACKAVFIVFVPPNIYWWICLDPNQAASGYETMPFDRLLTSSDRMLPFGNIGAIYTGGRDDMLPFASLDAMYFSKMDWKVVQ